MWSAVLRAISDQAAGLRLRASPLSLLHYKRVDCSAECSCVSGQGRSGAGLEAALDLGQVACGDSSSLGQVAQRDARVTSESGHGVCPAHEGKGHVVRNSVAVVRIESPKPVFSFDIADGQGFVFLHEQRCSPRASERLPRRFVKGHYATL